ncbi:hypothetical protein K9N68_07345 [Kovacikia minuta CCNUW1]|uniref:hypothetical protein n=1 Tax=Kovacikia minuta TaxID=2931930 RepID=UPI001CCFC1C9|nr:hypothetical protein [Kovacikia minuta]UBF27721.1 hypothetical protein K9N68_07345 [Kovacikia minuta CCNUW1]
MGRKKNGSFLLMVILCSTAGVILGGTSSWAESNQCMKADVLTQECLTKSPIVKTVEGMGVGLLAGIGAAIGATWQAKQGK